MKRLLLIGIIAYLFTGTAHAQILGGGLQCGDRDKMVAQLIERYSERLSHTAITARGTFLEVFIASTGGWTLLMSSVNGLTCVVGEGVNWEVIAPPPPPPPPSQQINRQTEPIENDEDS